MKRARATALITSVALAALGAGPAFATGATPTLTSTPQKLTGKYILLHADSARTDLDIPAILVGAVTYTLHGRSAYPFTPGQQIQAVGTLTGQDISVDTIAATPQAAVATPTSLNVLVELVTWTAPNAVTPAQAQNQYAVTNDTWFNNDSYGSLTMSASATNWLTIAPPPDPDGSGGNTPCDNVGVIQNEGDAAATAAGYSLSGFSNVVYYYPTCPAENWGGWGQVGGNRTWLIGEMDTRVAVHELGHNLGLNHSHSDTCTSSGVTVPYSTSCTVSEYGDPVSAMGGGFSGQGMYAANQQASLGWLGTASHAIQYVTGSGTFALAPYESSAGGTQALRIANGAGQEFWIEYRQPVGNDSFIWSADTNGVLIYSAAGTYSNLYDMTPNTPGTFTDAALPVGKVWSDPTSSLTVAVNSVGPSGASVTVKLATPTLSVTKSGAGTITSSPAGINCGVTCSASFVSGTPVTLTATPAPGSAFSGWGGACSGTSSTCSVTMTSPNSVTATFTGGLSVVEETSPQIQYYGTWSLGSCTGTSCSADHQQKYSKASGSRAVLSWTGTSADWIASKGPHGGKAVVYYDGVLMGTYDLYSPTTQDGLTIFSGPTLAAGTHSMRIKLTTPLRVNIDAFVTHP